MQNQSKYFFTSGLIKELENSESGSIHMLTSHELSGLNGMSFIEVKLKNKGVLNPLWHSNAEKIGYCTHGKILVSMHGPGGSEQFLVKAGEIFYIPQCQIHHIENASESEGIVKFALNNHDPENMLLSLAVDATADGVIQSNFSTTAEYASCLKKNASHAFIGTLDKKSPGAHSSVNRYKFDIERSAKVISATGGYLQVGLKVNLTELNGVGILGFGLEPGGAVEPHWHPNSSEIVYITKGRIRGMVLSPDKNIETHDVGAGEGFFAPAGHFHSIDNIGDGQVEGIAFFNNAESSYVGLGEAMGSFSDEVLASTFGLKADQLKELNKPGGPLVIIPS